MIKGKDIYEVLAAIVPLYVAMILAYGSVRWWKIFTPEQCSGINRFVSVFAVPLLSFNLISSNDPYSMNFRFLAADCLQKIVILVALFLWQLFFKGSLEWMITFFSLSTLPNTLVMGVPLLNSMYGNFSSSLMVQIVVLQSVIWYTLLLFMFEYRGAKLLISEQFPETGGYITSFKVQSDVMSLNGREPLQADAEIRDDGKLHVIIKRSMSSKSHGVDSIMSMGPLASELTGVEIYSIQSSREGTPRDTSFNHTDFLDMFSSPKNGYNRSDSFPQSSKREMSRNSNFGEEVMRFGKKGGRSSSSYHPRNPMISGSTSVGGSNPNKDLHMFVWSSSTSSSVSSKAVLQQQISTSRGMPDFAENAIRNMRDDYEFKIEDDSISPVNESTFSSDQKVDLGEERRLGGGNQMPPASVVTRLILTMVWRKLIRNPNTYTSFLGLIWSLIAYRFHFEMPTIVKGSITIMSNTGMGMAMFGLGLFMALQPKFIGCGKKVATYSMVIRFLVGPAVTAATSAAIGFRGTLLSVAIVQAALPQGLVPFVFAKEYNVHADILSTAVIFGMVVALPVTIIYYIVLGLF